MWPSNWDFGLFSDKNSLQKRLVKFILLKTIGKFVQSEIDWDKDLDVQISSGICVLKNVSLHPDALAEFFSSFPVSVKCGNIAKISVTISWSNLLSGGCKIEIDSPEIHIDLLDPKSSSFNPQNISGLFLLHFLNSYFTDAGQSILESSVYIADDFLKSEFLKNNPTSPSTTPPNNTPSPNHPLDDNTSKLDFLSDVVDKIIFGTDVYINNAKVILNYSLHDPQIQKSDFYPHQKLNKSIVFQFSQFTLLGHNPSSHTPHPNSHSNPNHNHNHNPNPNPSFGETKYKHVSYGKIEKFISLDNFRVYFKHGPKSHTLATFLDSQPKVTFSLFHKLKVAHFEPINYSIHSSEFGIYPDNGFLAPMPGEFRNIQSDPIDNPLNLPNSNQSNLPSSQNNVNDNSSSPEGWELDISIGTLAIILIPDVIGDIIYLSDLISRWLSIKNKTDELIRNFRSNQFPFDSTLHTNHDDNHDPNPNPNPNHNPNSESSSPLKKLISASIDKIFFCLISPDIDLNLGNLINSKRDSLSSWDSCSSFDALKKFLLSFKNLSATLQNIHSKIDLSVSPITSFPFENNQYNSDFIQFSISKFNLCEYDYLQEIREYHLLNIDRSDPNPNSNSLNVDIKGSFSQNFNSGRIDIAPIRLDLSLKILGRFDEYRKINLDSKSKTKSNSTNNTSHNSHSLRRDSFKNPRHRSNSLRRDSHKNTNHTFSPLSNTSTHFDDSDFVSKNNSGSFVQINDYVNTRPNILSKKVVPPQSDRLPPKNSTSKSNIFLFSELIRISITLPSPFGDGDHNEEYMSRLKNMGIYEFLIIDENIRKISKSSDSDKVLIIDWLNVEIYKSIRSNHLPSKSQNPKLNDQAPGIRLENGHLNIYLLEDRIPQKTSSKFSLDDMVLIASIEPHKDHSNSLDLPFSDPFLEIIFQSPDKKNKNSSHSSKLSSQHIPRPPALIGLQGSISHDAKSRRSLEAEMDSSQEYMKACLDKAQITIDLFLPFIYVSLDREKSFLLKKYLETLSLWINKQQMLNQSSAVDNSKQLEKTLSVFSANIKRVVIKVENKLKHEIHLKNTKTFIIAGLVENEKTYCHLHSQNLDIRSVNESLQILQVFGCTTKKSGVDGIALPQISLDYLSTPKVEDLNELVVRVDWSTIDLDQIDVIYTDLLEFFQSGNAKNDNSSVYSDSLDLGNQFEYGELEKDSLDILPKMDLNSTNDLETSPLQLYLFIRSLSFRYSIRPADHGIPIDKNCPRSMVLGLDSILFLKLFEPESLAKPNDDHTYKFIVGGISLFGEPSFASEMIKNGTPFLNESANSNFSNSTMNLEKFWSSQGSISLLHIVMIDLCVSSNLVVVECETVKVDVNRDTIKTLKLVSQFFANRFSPPPSTNKSLGNKHSAFVIPHLINVLDGIEDMSPKSWKSHLTKSGSGLSSRDRGSSTLNPGDFVSNSHDANIQNSDDFVSKSYDANIQNSDDFVSKSYDANIQNSGDLVNRNYSVSVKENLVGKGNTENSDFRVKSSDGDEDSDYENVSALEAQDVMNEYRKKASIYRAQESKSGFSNLNFNYLDEPISPSKKNQNEYYYSKTGNTSNGLKNPNKESWNSNLVSESCINIKKPKKPIVYGSDFKSDDLKSFSLTDKSEIFLIEDYIGSSSDCSINESKSVLGISNAEGTKSNVRKKSSLENNGSKSKKATFKLNAVIGKIQIFLFDSNSWSTENGPIKLNINQKPQMEFELKNKRVQFSVYEDPSDIKWDLALDLSQFIIYDKIEGSLWNKFLARMRESEYKNYEIHPTLFYNTNSHVTNIPGTEWMGNNKYMDPILPDMLKARIEAVVLRTSIGSELGTFNRVANVGYEYRFDLGISPIRSYIDQDALVFLIGFFSDFNGDDDEAKKTKEEVDFGVNQNERKEFNNPHQRNGKPGYGAVPYFQAITISQIILKFDYKPKLYPLSDRDLLPESLAKLPLVVEILNLIAIEEASLSLKPIQLFGVSGIDKLISKALEIWIPHVKENQIPGVVGSITPLKPLSNIGSAAVDVLILPMSEYKKNGRWYKGFRKGLNAFAKVGALETVSIGTKLAVNTQTAFERAGEIFNIPTANSHHANSGLAEYEGLQKNVASTSKYAIQPRNVSEGVKQAYQGMARNLGQVAQTILAIPVQISENYIGDDLLQFGYVDSRTEDDLVPDLGLAVDADLNGPRQYIDDTDDSDGIEAAGNYKVLGVSDPRDDGGSGEDQFVFLDYSRAGRAEFDYESMPGKRSGVSSQQRAMVNNSVKNMVRAVPVAILNPIIGASEAVSKTLLGFRNSLEKSRNERLQDVSTFFPNLVKFIQNIRLGRNGNSRLYKSRGGVGKVKR
ncbi:Autophagy-related protein 2 [Smittium mucronatum]|uniref:Autophagy-related protein 2 n=1 Tax=Smittium mucronatum TaxID=133383 RepID=A0A1R0GW59_9FUNG|nr:Autophagy-related protein 2 [Smittium mucronatum]